MKKIHLFLMFSAVFICLMLMNSCARESRSDYTAVGKSEMKSSEKPMAVLDEVAAESDSTFGTASTSTPPPAPEDGRSIKSGMAFERGKGRTKPVKSGLKAGFADDNKQYNYFLNFLDKYKQIQHYPIDVTERIIIQVSDQSDKNLPDSNVRIYTGQKLLEEGLTYSDGTFLFFPSQYPDINRFSAVISHGQVEEKIHLEKTGKRKYVVQLAKKFQPQQLPVDIVFVFDTTGSMGEEIARLKKTIELIHLNLSSISTNVDIKLRFGMVLYKDRNDLYVTKTIPLTGDLESFQSKLNRVRASGGGDTPEDLQAALQMAMKEIVWTPDGIKAGFVITDAPPHLDYGQSYSYVKAAMEAKKRGIKLFTIGTGGLNITGEYILRQISQYTSANYIFLTYGEKGESEGGSPGSVSHHTGDNFQTDKLEALIIKLMRKEINAYTGRSPDEQAEYFHASKIDDESSKETLQKLFSKAISQLVDFSSKRISTPTPMAVLPFINKNSVSDVNMEYFTNELVLSLSQNKTFKLVERKDVQQIEDEIDFQLSDSIIGKRIKDLGEKTGAEILLLGELYKKPVQYDLFLKLIDVKSAEILSVTKTTIDKKLGL